MIRLRTLVVFAVAAAVALCFSTSIAMAAKYSSIPSLGFVFGDYETSTPDRAQQAMSDAAALRANTAEIVVNYKDPQKADPSASPIDLYELDDVCYAAQAAQNNSLAELVLKVQPKRWLWPALHDVDALSRYNAALNVLIDKVASCINWLAPVIPRIGIQLGNEPNSNDFCGYQDKVQNQQTPQTSRHQMCAGEAAQLDRSGSDFIQRKQALLQRSQIHLDIRVYILGVSSHSDPIGFAKLYCSAVQSLGYSGQWLGDRIGFNPYTLAGTKDNLSGYRLGEKFYAILQSPRCLGSTAQKCYTEAGDESVTSVPDPLYINGEPATVPTVAGNLFASTTVQELTFAGQNGSQCYWHFLIKDEPDLHGWQSGVEKPDGTHKTYTNVFGSIGSIFDDFAAAFATFASPTQIKAQP